MPRFFFDADDGEHVTRDNVGTDLPSLQDAKAQAFLFLQDLSHGLIVEGSIVRSCAVREGDGAAVYRITMAVEGRTAAS